MSKSRPIIQFSTDRTTIHSGEDVTLRWRVEGVKAVYLFPEGRPWQEHGVVGQGEQRVSPSQTTAYHLRVVKADDSVDVHKIRVQVRAPGSSQAFSVDRIEIDRGECVTFRWHVEGVKAVYFVPEGEPWQEHGVVGVGEQRVCPAETTTYRLRVVRVDGSVEVHDIRILVRAPGSSQIFAVDRAEIDRGECVTFRWHVEGVKAVYFVPEGERWQEHGVVGIGEQRVCPAETTTYDLRVVGADDSVEVHKIRVQVRAPGPSQIFSVDRIEIARGECVTFRWHVEGVKAVYFVPEGERWQDHGVAGIGEQQVCPAETTTYRLRVIKADSSVEIHYITVHVRG